MNEQKTAPESEQSVAAVGNNEAPAASPPAEPKTAPAGERPGSAAPPAPHNRPDSVVAVGPVPPAEQQRLLRRLSRTSAVWLITVPGAVLCLIATAFELCTTPQEVWQVAFTYLIVLALCLAWIILMRLIHGRRAEPPALWSDVRINELHPQGAVSRGANGTVVLPFEEVTRYEETADGLTLFGAGGVIRWSADDLTPATATQIQLYLRAHVPGAAIQIKETFRAHAAASLPLPELPKRGACHAEATAETRPRKVAVVRWGRALARSTPLMWMLAMSAGLLLHEMFVFSDPALNSPWIWFVLLAALQAVALFGLIWWQAAATFWLLRWDAAARRKQPYSTPEFFFCEDGMWMTVGRGDVRFPRGAVTATWLPDALELRLPSGFVRLPYSSMSDPRLIFRYFEFVE